MAIFLNLSNELILALASYLQDSKDIASLLSVNRRLHQLLALQLFKHDARQPNGSFALPWAAKNGRIETLQLAISAGAKPPKNTAILVSAAEGGHTKVVEALLDLPGIRVEDEDEEYQTALGVAAKGGHAQIVAALLDKGANIAVPSEVDMSPLDWAAYSGSVEVIKILLAHGADVNKGCTILRPPLFWAAQAGQDDAVRFLLDHGASMTFRTVNNWQAIQEAAKSGHANVIKTLIEHGADPLGDYSNGCTPLCLAAENCHLEAVKMLLDKGGAAQLTGESGSRVLRAAAAGGDTEVAELLLLQGVDVTLMSDGFTALHSAVNLSQLDMAKLLLARGAEIDVSGQMGWTALHYAADNGDVETVKMLLSKNADATVVTEAGESALQLAVAGDNIDAARILLANGNNEILQSRDHEGQTALHNAAEQGYESVIELLLDHGANPTIKDLSGDTALHLAAYHRQLGAVQALLKAKSIDVDAKNDNGRSALFLAAAKGHTDIFILLLSHHANPETKDSYQCSVLLAAVRNNSCRIIAHLLFNKLVETPSAFSAIDFFGRTPMWWAKSIGIPGLIADLTDHGDSEDITALPSLVEFRGSTTNGDRDAHCCSVCTRCTIRDTTLLWCTRCDGRRYFICVDCQDAGVTKCRHRTHRLREHLCEEYE
ncbi:ankyrin [Pochonia chlamydosporia 170]|uniref:Ankyrin n=1 Tax=Pochonia chlamydosporia 170 TaxID=1380566 RepID=A0A179FKU8_METCM|nr:ankyrin [Pochonia chlamydosporia 170]OAQ65927.1 ankyrin [Pochonia chlamydosporia 170]